MHKVCAQISLRSFVILSFSVIQQKVSYIIQSWSKLLVPLINMIKKAVKIICIVYIHWSLIFQSSGSSLYPVQMVDQHLEMTSTTLNVSETRMTRWARGRSPAETSSPKQPSAQDQRNQMSPLHNLTLLQHGIKHRYYLNWTELVDDITESMINWL